MPLPPTAPRTMANTTLRRRRRRPLPLPAAVGVAALCCWWCAGWSAVFGLSMRQWEPRNWRRQSSVPTIAANKHAPISASSSTQCRRHTCGWRISTIASAANQGGDDTGSAAPATTITPSSSSPSCSSSSSSYGLLYQVQEDMLVQRGMYEQELMSRCLTRSLESPTVKKGVSGKKKGFGGGTSMGPSPISNKSNKSLFATEAALYASILRTDGVVRIDNVLTDECADELLDFVTALRQTSLEQVAAGMPMNRFADVLLRSNRCDLKLPLGNIPSTSNEKSTKGTITLLSSSPSPVMKAMFDVLCHSALPETLEVAGLSKDAILHELSCMISDPGSQRQVIHPDTPYMATADHPTLLTCFIALQDIDESMGPTVFLPGTHTLEHHAAFADESRTSAATDTLETSLSPKDSVLQNAPLVLLGTLAKGSCAIYDSRLLHCGSANQSTLKKSRAIFYTSWRHPDTPNTGNPPSIRAELGAAQIPLTELTSIVRTVHIKGTAANPFAFD